MREGQSFANFRDLRRAHEPEESNQEMFDRLLRDHMEAAPPGSFTVNREPLTSITLVPHRQENKPENPVNQVFATVFYRRPDGKESHFTASIYADGQIGGQVPADAKISRAEILRQVLTTVDKVDTKFWEGIEGHVVGEQDRLGPQEPSSEGDEESARPFKRAIDPERLKFLEENPGSLFGFYSEEIGFDGYHGVVYPNCVVLEHPRTGNAMYIIPLPETLEVDEEILARPANQRTSSAERHELLKTIWYPIRDQASTRRSLKELGAKKVTHKGPNWKKRAAATILETKPSPETAH